MQSAKFLFSYLTANPISGVTGYYNQIAPFNAVYPYIITTNAASTTEITDGVTRFNEVWQVKVVSDNPSTAYNVQGLIYQRLHYANLSLDSGWGGLAIQADSAFNPPPEVTDQNKLIYHYGWSFRIRYYDKEYQS